VVRLLGRRRLDLHVGHRGQDNPGAGRAADELVVHAAVSTLFTVS